MLRPANAIFVAETLPIENKAIPIFGISHPDIGRLIDRVAKIPCRVYNHDIFYHEATFYDVVSYFYGFVGAHRCRNNLVTHASLVVHVKPNKQQEAQYEHWRRQEKLRQEDGAESGNDGRGDEKATE
jgi:hypothetical protein